LLLLPLPFVYIYAHDAVSLLLLLTIAAATILPRYAGAAADYAYTPYAMLIYVAYGVSLSACPPCARYTRCAVCF